MNNTCENDQGTTRQQHLSWDDFGNADDLIDARLFVGRVSDTLVAGNLHREEAIREICFYIMKATAPQLASFLREDLVSTMDGYTFEGL